MRTTSVLLLQLCIFHAMVFAVPSCRLRGQLVREAHRTLRDLGVSFPDRCRPYYIPFPDSALPAATAKHTQCRQASWVVYESLRGADQMFLDHDVPVGEGGVNWDSEKLDNFRMTQDRVLEVGSCFPAVNASGLLSPYFGNMTVLLQAQDSATCGWLALMRNQLKVLESVLHKHHNCFL